MSTVIVMVQFFFTIVIGLYFLGQLKNQQGTRNNIEKDTKKELERLNQMRRISLTKPLTEKTRPARFSEIIGQEEGVKALRVALCGPNPQHVLIYGPPGVGKTAAARVALKEAVRMGMAPFLKDAKFIETDATTMRFDERSIADPLIGSVHDPIYQGAGAYGPAGVPQPKEGAVTKAHGGILFIDEIGELHPIQMNKLLKVLEDRTVFFESAYYSEEDSNIPRHIHDVFKNGLPADFRLVGATTRSPEEIPPAIRSRCMEIFFHNLDEEDLKKIVENASEKLDVRLEDGCSDLICHYAQNGRDAVRILQTSASAAILEKREQINVTDVEWVVKTGHYLPKYDPCVNEGQRIGVVNGLGVAGAGDGVLMSIEVTAEKVRHGRGRVLCTGIVEEESIEQGRQRLSRTSTARAAVDNVMTALYRVAGINRLDYQIHINFPGGMPVDGPSAGVAIFCGVYSAVKQIPIDNLIALTGEVSIQGLIKPVGGVSEKIEAARRAGVQTVYIPCDNMQQSFLEAGVSVIPVRTLGEILKDIFGKEEKKVVEIEEGNRPATVVSAKGTEKGLNY